MKKSVCLALAAIFAAVLVSGGVMILVWANSGSTGAGPEGISLEEFERIEPGASMYDVEDIIGGSLGTLKSKKVVNGVTTSAYEIPGENGGSALLTFEYDYDKDMFGFNLISKEQNNLR